MIPTELGSIASHIWQSTLFAGVCGLLALAMRRNKARVRYGIWLAASYKFLLPFSWLVALGRQFEWRTVAASLPHAVSTVTDAISAPTFLIPSVAAKPAPDHLPLLPLVIWSVWGCGLLIVVAGWMREWLRIRAVVRAAAPLPFALPIPVVSIPSRLEPGVFGIFRPVLLLPEGIAEKLSPTQLRVVLAHELCHVRRRDNLAAAVHMLVEALFWFHPLVWWLNHRIVDERERACDEEVMSMGSEPADYVETILTVCKSYVESPMACMSGISGSDLKRRILHIMTHSLTENLTCSRRVILSIVGAMAVAGPLVFGVISAPQVRAASNQSVFTVAEAAYSAATTSARHAQASQPAATQPAVAQLPSFEAVSIKPESSTTMAYGSGDPGHGFMQGASADNLIGSAYNVRQFQIVGLPSWAKNKNYDIETKTDAATVAKLQSMPVEARHAYYRLMLQSLLADRFKLQVHHVTVQGNGYGLIITKAGKLHADNCATKSSGGAACGENTRYPGHIELKSVPIAGDGSLIQSLEIFTGSTVLDHTDLTGRYDITLDWIPDPGQVAAPGVSVPPPEPNAPSLQTALEETLGLKLVSTKVPMDTVVIDHIEEPTPN